VQRSKKTLVAAVARAEWLNYKLAPAQLREDFNEK
jgi:hypothetical protein